MLIQYKIQQHPNDGSRSNWRLRNSSFDRTSAKEKDDGGGKASFARFWHPDARSEQLIFQILSLLNEIRTIKYLPPV